MLGGVIELDENRLHYSIGGHLPMPVLYSQGQAQYLKGGGLPVGLFAEAVYSDQELLLPERFSLMLASDGILDLLPGKTLAEKEQALPEVLIRASGTLEGLASCLNMDSLADMPDDIALLVLSRNLV